MNVEDKVRDALRKTAAGTGAAPADWGVIRANARRVGARRRARNVGIVALSVLMIAAAVVAVAEGGRSPQRSGMVGTPKRETVRVVQVQGPGVSEGSGEDLVDRIFSTCDVVVYKYHLLYTGTTSVPPNIRIRAGEIRAAANGSVAGNDTGGGLWKPSGAERLAFTPEPGERDVVHNGHARLDQAVCVGRQSKMSFTGG